MRITHQWVRTRANIPDNERDQDIESLCLPGNATCGKISDVGDAFKEFSGLKELDLSRNCLTSTKGLECLQSLRVLNLYYNQISTQDELLRLTVLPNLHTLDLRLNPVARGDPGYRLWAIYTFPSLTTLDERAVREAERRRAKQIHNTDDSESDTEQQPHVSAASNKVGQRGTTRSRNDGDVEGDISDKICVNKSTRTHEKVTSADVDEETSDSGSASTSRTDDSAPGSDNEGDTVDRSQIPHTRPPKGDSVASGSVVSQDFASAPPSLAVGRIGRPPFGSEPSSPSSSLVDAVIFGPPPSFRDLSVGSSVGKEGSRRDRQISRPVSHGAQTPPHWRDQQHPRNSTQPHSRTQPPPQSQPTVPTSTPASSSASKPFGQHIVSSEYAHEADSSYSYTDSEETGEDKKLRESLERARGVVPAMCGTSPRPSHSSDSGREKPRQVRFDNTVYVCELESEGTDIRSRPSYPETRCPENRANYQTTPSPSANENVVVVPSARGVPPEIVSPSQGQSGSATDPAGYVPREHFSMDTCGVTSAGPTSYDDAGLWSARPVPLTPLDQQRGTSPNSHISMTSQHPSHPRSHSPLVPPKEGEARQNHMQFSPHTASTPNMCSAASHSADSRAPATPTVLPAPLPPQTPTSEVPFAYPRGHEGSWSTLVETPKQKGTTANDMTAYFSDVTASPQTEAETPSSTKANGHWRTEDYSTGETETVSPMDGQATTVVDPVLHLKYQVWRLFDDHAERLRDQGSGGLPHSWWRQDQTFNARMDGLLARALAAAAAYGATHGLDPTRLDPAHPPPRTAQQRVTADRRDNGVERQRGDTDDLKRKLDEAEAAKRNAELESDRLRSELSSVRTALSSAQARLEAKAKSDARSLVDMLSESHRALMENNNQFLGTIKEMKAKQAQDAEVWSQSFEQLKAYYESKHPNVPPPSSTSGQFISVEESVSTASLIPGPSRELRPSPNSDSHGDLENQVISSSER
eukprot:Rmarinus@m.7639